MGVPGFYKWLIQRYPLIRRRFNDPSRPKIDNFYVDFNSIVYCSIKVIKDYSKPYTKLFQEILRYLDLLVQVVRSRSTLYISVDGPSPFAKCKEQRIHRYLLIEQSDLTLFDTNCISIGTEFMHMLHQELISFLEEKSKNDLAYKNLDIIYSSVKSAGEGENKIFRFIQQHSSDFNPNTTHLIFSPDADVLIIGLQSNIPYFYVMRE